MLLVEDSSVLLLVRCHCTSGVVWKDVEWAVYIESTYSDTMLLCIMHYSVRSCVLYIKVLQSFIGCGHGWCGMYGIVVCMWLEKCLKI